MESSSRFDSKIHEIYKAGIGLHPSDLVLSKGCSPAHLSLALESFIRIPSMEKTRTGASCSPADRGSVVDMGMALSSGLVWGSWTLSSRKAASGLLTCAHRAPLAFLDGTLSPGLTKFFRSDILCSALTSCLGHASPVPVVMSFLWLL